MAVRFDEIELLKEPELPPPQTVSAAPSVPHVYPTSVRPRPPRPRPLESRSRTPEIRAASRFHRTVGLLTDLSLFIALALALSPLLRYHADWQITLAEEWPTVLGLGGFLLLLSYYYFVTSWLIWGKTVGAAIFDVRVISEDGSPMRARDLTRRWGAMLLSILVGGTGFLVALLPGGRSLADRLSHTRSIAA
jgi:uncharacterized RDD family membrane protein YckC